MENSSKALEELFRQFEEGDDIGALRKALALMESAEIGAASKSEQMAAKAETLRMFLRAFNSIDAKLIPGFDLSELPSLSVAPPPETGLPAGVSPSSIADPEMRALYEKAILANQAKVASYNLQSNLQKLDKRWMGAFETFVSTHYSKSSEEMLNRELDTHITYESRKKLLRERIHAAFE